MTRRPNTPHTKRHTREEQPANTGHMSGLTDSLLAGQP